ncbi:uncharacterized protein METZ01_LOCUS40166, partial [marine metagenome]|tara:strand:+ start:260 stop:841 length:582 start_codon:yes stop_codon:yes gene_type:complete
VAYFITAFQYIRNSNPMTGLLMKQQNFLPLRISVLVVSDTRTEETDTSGKIFAERLTEEGHSLAEKCIVPDDIYQIRAVLSRWIVDPAVDIILTTGGTGLTGRDGTPEAVIPLFDKVIEGFGEMFRQISYDEISTSTIQSRVTAGVANGTYIFCLPGSSGACRTGWDKILSTQLDIRSRPCNFAEMLPRLTEQ